MIFKDAFLALQGSKLSNIKTSSISKQISVTKIQIFSFREEKCSSIWSYDKNISTFWKKHTFIYIHNNSGNKNEDEKLEILFTF